MSVNTKTKRNCVLLSVNHKKLGELNFCPGKDWPVDSIVSNKRTNRFEWNPHGGFAYDPTRGVNTFAHPRKTFAEKIPNRGLRFRDGKGKLTPSSARASQTKIPYTDIPFEALNRSSMMGATGEHGPGLLDQMTCHAVCTPVVGYSYSRSWTTFAVSRDRKIC